MPSAARKAHPSTEDPAQLSLFSVPCELLPLGDGTWRVVPGKPQEKLTVRQAAKLLSISASGVRRLYHAGELEGVQPTPRTLRLFAASMEAHLRRTGGCGAEHWTAARREKMRV